MDQRDSTVIKVLALYATPSTAPLEVIPEHYGGGKKKAKYSK